MSQNELCYTQGLFGFLHIAEHSFMDTLMGNRRNTGVLSGQYRSHTHTQTHKHREKEERIKYRTDERLKWNTLLEEVDDEFNLTHR